MYSPHSPHAATAEATHERSDVLDLAAGIERRRESGNPCRMERGPMHRVLAILALPLAVVMACKSDDDEQKSPQDSYPGRFSQAVCTAMEPCCKANGLAFDRGSCELGGA